MKRKWLICGWKQWAVRFCVVALALTQLAAAGAGDKPFVKPSPKDKCPVCGMFVAKYPDFIAEIIFKDGSYAVFDGAKDMFKFYWEMEKYGPGKKKSEIDSIYVTDYYSLELIDGMKAYYVIGSNVYQTMGKELIPFAKEEEAREFVRDHVGKEILRFQEVDGATVRGLDQ